MSEFIDKNLREYLEAYFKPIQDIKYVTGEDIGRTYVKDLSKINFIEDLTQLNGLVKLYYLNEYMEKLGNPSYLRIDIDDEGIKYASVTQEFILLANIADFSNVKNNHPKFVNINDSKKNKNIAMEVGDEYVFEDNIDERLTDEMYDRASGYCGVKEMSNNKETLSKKYGMVFVPVNNTLADTKIVADNNGVLMDAYNYVPIIKTLEFKLFFS